ncbi:hypothetical protein ACLB2K_050372 [Fragaria x ananassa]
MNVISSVGIIMANKQLMSTAGYAFSFATTLTGFHFAVTALVGFVSNASGYSASKQVPFWELLWFSIVANVSITAMNFSLMLNSVGFYQSIGSLQKKHSVGSFELLSKTAPIQAVSLLIFGPFIDYCLSGIFITNYKLSSGVIAFILLSCSLAVFCNISQYLCIGRFSAVSFQVLVVGMVIYSWAVEAEKQPGKPLSNSKTSLTEEEINLLKVGLDTGATVKDVEHAATKL